MSVVDDLGWTVLSVVVSALVSGLLGVLVSNWYYRRNEIRRLKLKVLQQLMGSRYDFHNERMVEALNQIPVVFYESKEVLTAFKAYQEHCMNPVQNYDLGIERLLDLFKAMYKHLNIDTAPLTDNNIRNFFTPTTTDHEESK